MIEDYYKEFEGLACFKYKDKGFIFYKMYNNEVIYIDTIYVRPEFRRANTGTEMANALCAQLFPLFPGLHEIYSKVHKTTKGWQTALKFQLKWGMNPFNYDDTSIQLIKKIDEEFRSQIKKQNKKA